jgi:hypothetical protein
MYAGCCRVAPPSIERTPQHSNHPTDDGEVAAAFADCVPPRVEVAFGTFSPIKGGGIRCFY